MTNNFKGMALRRDDAEKTFLYIISDDNFHNLQRTVPLMFALAEQAGCRHPD